MGGNIGLGAATVDIYDNATGAWSTAPLAATSAYLAATTVGTKALFAGGCDSSGKCDIVNIYDSDTNSWSTAHLSMQRPNAIALTVGTKAIFVGGALPTVDTPL